MSTTLTLSAGLTSCRHQGRPRPSLLCSQNCTLWMQSSPKTQMLSFSVRQPFCTCEWHPNHFPSHSLLMIVCSDVKFSKTEGVHMYHAGDVAGMGLNADALVLISLLAGGDYSVRPPVYGLTTHCKLLTSHILTEWSAWMWPQDSICTCTSRVRYTAHPGNQESSYQHCCVPVLLV
jgi:hypothetical protein